MHPILLLNITGPDHPGLTAELTTRLARHGVNVLDIGQAVIHDHLNLGMLLEVPKTEDTAMRRALKRIGGQYDLHTEFTSINPDDYEYWVATEDRTRFIATLLIRELGTDNIAHMAQVAALHDLNINGITRLSGRFSLRGEVADEESLCHDLLAIIRNDEVINELARAAGTYEEVAAITETAIRGKIPFDESLRQRPAILQRQDISVLERIARELPMLSIAGPDIAFHARPVVRNREVSA